MGAVTAPSMSLGRAHPFLFFLVAVAYTCGWTAIGSELGRLSLLYGPSVLLLCSLAYFLPSLPVLALQLLFDERCDKQFGRLRSNRVRAIAGFGGCTLVAGAYPYLPETLPYLLSAVAALGVSSSIALGSSYQLAVGQPPQATVALSLGFVCSGPFLLAVEGVLQLGPYCSWHRVMLLYAVVAALSAAGLVASLVAQVRIWRPALPLSGGEGGGQHGAGEAQRLLPMTASHGTQQQLGGQQAQRAGSPPLLLEHDGSIDIEVEILDSPGPPWPAEAAAGGQQRGGEGWWVYAEVLRQVWPAALALATSVGTSMMLFPLFTFVPTSGWLGMMLPQALFWVRVFSDAAGRVVPRYWAVTSPTALLMLAGLKLGLTPLLPAYIRGHVIPFHAYLDPISGDAAALAYVAVQWLLSGYINSCCAIAGPMRVPAEMGRKAASALSLVFQSACLAGVLTAVPVKAWAAGG